MSTTNPFSLLPWDTKDAIVRYLDTSWAFNEVLRRDERVYKKLLPDYALTINLRVLATKYTSLVNKANNAVSMWRWTRVPLIRATIARQAFLDTYIALFHFFADPMSAPLFAYQNGFKAKQVDVLNYWNVTSLMRLTDWDESFIYLSSVQIEDFRNALRKALSAVNRVEYIRHIVT